MSSPLAGRSTDGLRRAALTLHALVPAERHWMLDRLPAARRGEVEALLAELADLGIPQDRSLVFAALRRGLRPPAKSPTAAPERGPDSGALINLLRKEPTALIAIALEAQAPCVRDEVLRGLPPRASQEAGRRIAPATKVPPALRAAILEELAPRTLAAAERPAPSPTTFIRRWRTRWQRMTGGSA